MKIRSRFLRVGVVNGRRASLVGAWEEMKRVPWLGGIHHMPACSENLGWYGNADDSCMLLK